MNKCTCGKQEKIYGSIGYTLSKLDYQPPGSGGWTTWKNVKIHGELFAFCKSSLTYHFVYYMGDYRWRNSMQSMSLKEIEDWIKPWILSASVGRKL